MTNEVIELPVRQESNNFPVTNEAVEALKRQRDLLKSFVQSQLKKETDFGIVPGTEKNTLYKPGAEKIARLFSLGVRIKLSDREIDRKENFAMFTYQAEVYLLQNDSVVIAQCEGSCNSQEKKYKERSVYEWVDQTRSDGGSFRKKVYKGKEETPICDVLNTLQKMAQKRAYVGAVILATAASDFFTQDIDDPEDAAALGVTEKSEPTRVSASVPTATSAISQHEGQPSNAKPTSSRSCQICGTALVVTKAGNAYNCPNWKDKAKGDHTYIRMEQQ